MDIEIATIGGYEEVGRQMTAVRAGNDIVIFDMGLNLSKVLIHDNIQTEGMHSLDLIDMGAIPDDRVMSDLEGDVRAIVPTHGHLDHIGAISKLAHRYDAPIVATPFTLELVKGELEDENKFGSDNELIQMDAGETMTIGDHGIELEFVNVTHSIIQAINPFSTRRRARSSTGWTNGWTTRRLSAINRYEALPGDRSGRRPLLYRRLYEREQEGRTLPSRSPVNTFGIPFIAWRTTTAGSSRRRSRAISLG